MNRLLALTDQWKELHRAALAADIATAQRSLETLRWLLFSSALALLALAGLVAALVHHGLLVPLRQELVVRDALLVRQEKLASLGVLAAGVAHEIRNPLTAIKARLFSQTRRLDPGSPEHADGLVIKDEIQRLETIVKDVLQFARPGDPQLTVQSAPALLREVAALMRPELEKRAIALTVEPGEEFLIALDSAQMKQVLINLVQNAADSIGQAGNVGLRARRTVLPRAPRRTEAVALEVEDDGRGVPPAVQARLFDPFFTTKAAGTGLGLSIAERIAGKHGGTLGFQTRPGRGATFRVILPMPDRAPTPPSGRPPRPPPDRYLPVNPAARLLLIEDDPAIAASLQQVLGEEGYAVTPADRGDLGLRLAGEGRFDVILTDLRLPGLDGLELVGRLHRSHPRRPIILMTAHGTADTAIEATRRGAYDYLLKPFDMHELLDVLGKAVRSARLVSTPVTLGGGDPAAEPPDDSIIGGSRAMQAVFKEIGRVAARPVPVLIRGETGTGKELIARAILQHSDRAERPFVAVNCAAIPETLLESELFGHERGAFTGAETRRIGRFEQADGGTLFLDEIGDLTPGTQVKLLRVLQEKTIRRVGGSDPIPVDVRVLAATHRDLEQAIAAKEFREDLFYRLNVVTLALPSLAQRPEDIPALVAYFLRRHGEDLGVPQPAIQPAALAALAARPWPGNVRELENTVRRALLLSRGYPIDANLIAAVVAGATASVLPPPDNPGRAPPFPVRLPACSTRPGGVKPGTFTAGSW